MTLWLDFHSELPEQLLIPDSIEFSICDTKNKMSSMRRNRNGKPWSRMPRGVIGLVGSSQLQMRNDCNYQALDLVTHFVELGVVCSL